MKVQVTKTLCKELKKNIKSFDIEYIELPLNQYKSTIDFDIYDHEIDYNFEKGVFKAFKIIYPYDCYALPQYITTKDLKRLFKDMVMSQDSLTIKNFCKRFELNYQI